MVNQLILLNGTSCSGKSSLSREMRNLADRPYLAVSSDLFLPMLPGRYTGVDAAITRKMLEGKQQVDAAVHRAVAAWSDVDAPLPKLGFQVTMREDGDGRTSYHSSCGPVGWNLVAGMHRAVAALVHAGNDVIMEDVASAVLMRDYCLALAGLRVYVVGVKCSLEETERRERERSNRGVGAVRMQFARVHDPGDYDVTVDTEALRPEEGARRILDHVTAHEPAAFARLVSRFSQTPLPPFPIETF